MDSIDFYLSKDEPLKSCFLSLRDHILESSDQFSETVKYGMPCFTVNGKPICYLWMNKINPYVLFVDGSKFNDPDLISGTRKRMKIFYVDPLKDLPILKITSLLKIAAGTM